MEKRRNYLSALLIISAPAGILMYLIGHKYLHLFSYSTVYFCKEATFAATYYALPKIMSYIAIGSVSLFGMNVFIRVLFLLGRLMVLQKKLSKTSYSTHATKKIIKKMNLDHLVRIFHSNEPEALCFGLLQPKIYISTELIKQVTEKELTLILLHEKHHCEKKDNLFIVLGLLLQTFFPFLPLISQRVSQFRIHQELRADSYALKNYPHGSRYILTALKKLLLFNSGTMIPAVAFSAEEALHARILYLSEKKPYVPKQNTKKNVLTFFSFCLLVAVAALPIKAVEIGDEANSAMLTCFAKSSCSLVCEKQAHQLPMTPKTNQSLLLSPAIFVQ